MQSALPAAPGTYVLVLRSPRTGRVEIGRLGTLVLDGGWLLYAGSALGPGGLRARVGRHVSAAGRVHWHIDHLVRVAEVVEVWYQEGDARREDEWAEALRSAPGARIPLAGFGASDCGCAGHLVRFDERPATVAPGSATWTP